MERPDAPTIDDVAEQQLIAFLERVGSGETSGTFAEWPQLRPACRYAAKKLRARHLESGAPALRDDAQSLGNLVDFLGEKKGELEAMCENPGRLWQTVEAAARLVAALAPEPTPEPIQGGRD